MDKEDSLYEVVKEFTSLQAVYVQQQQLLKTKSKVKLWATIKDFFLILDDIAAVPVDSFNNWLKEEETEEPSLEIQHESAFYLQDIKEKIAKLFIEATETTEMKIPYDLEKCLEDLGSEMREQKEQLKISSSLAKNLAYILENYKTHSNKDILNLPEAINIEIIINDGEKENM